MADSEPESQLAVLVGLCAQCRWAARVPTDKARCYWRCRRSEVDTRYPRYPRLPMVVCAGYQPHEDEPSGQAGAEGSN